MPKVYQHCLRCGVHRRTPNANPYCSNACHRGSITYGDSHHSVKDIHIAERRLALDEKLWRCSTHWEREEVRAEIAALG
jgi:Fe-S-cluster-containing dehydrogenase component